MKGLILIYAITVLGSIGALRSPVIGLFVYVGFAVLRPQFIFGFAGNFEGISLIIGVATLIGWAAGGFGTLKMGPGKSIVVALLLFCAWTVISASQAVDTSIAYAELVPMAKFVMPFLIGVTVLDSEQRTRTMMWIIVLAQGYVGFEMNLAYLKGFNIANEGFGGMDNNCFGVSLVTTIGPAIALAIGAKTWWEKGLAAAAAALILHTTLLTFSRGAMVGLLIVGFTAFVIMPKRPKQLAALALIGLLAIRLTGPQLLARYGTALAQDEERDGSAESRLDLWRDCLKIAAGRPVFGVGPGNFRVVASSLGWTPGKQAHSTWMQTLAEDGAPGLLVLLLFFAIPVVKLWPLARATVTEENRYEVAVASGIIMCVVGFLVTGQFVSLGGLEIPYYATMIGVVILNKKALVVAAPVKVQQMPLRPTLAPAQRVRFGGPMAVPRPGRH
jgi:probable O-glycosylation ligase (exosortase A-associated)